MPELVLTQGGRGGVGKTCALVATADYLQSKGIKFVPIDCDQENAGKLSSFAHWFDGKAARLDLRNPDDCDKLLEGASEAPVPYVLADLPANSSGDLAKWWKTVATPETLAALKLTVTAVGVVTPHHGSAESVWEWIDTLGTHVRYLIALNRLTFCRVIVPAEEAFPDWFGFFKREQSPIQAHTFEIPHLNDRAMQELVRLGKLPGKAISLPAMRIIARQQVAEWRKAIHAQLDGLGLFAAPKTKAAAPAATAEAPK
jgi:hypothetical protein